MDTCLLADPRLHLAVAIDAGQLRRREIFFDCLLHSCNRRRKVRTLREPLRRISRRKNVFNPIHIASKSTTAQTRRDAAAYGRLCVDEGNDTID
jgi:hypothetical protein